MTANKYADTHVVCLAILHFCGPRVITFWVETPQAWVPLQIVIVAFYKPDVMPIAESTKPTSVYTYAGLLTRHLHNGNKITLHLGKLNELHRCSILKARTDFSGI